MIKTSLEWNNLDIKLQKQTKSLKPTYRYELIKLISNVRHRITNLSIAEVDARRGNSAKAVELLVAINTDIELIEEYLIIATLLG